MTFEHLLSQSLSLKCGNSQCRKKREDKNLIRGEEISNLQRTMMNVKDSGKSISMVCKSKGTIQSANLCL